MITKTQAGSALYVTGGRLVDPAAKKDGPADLLVDGGRVFAVGKPGELKAKAKSLKAEVLDVDGLVVCPGFVDLNCAVYEPGAEHVESFATVSAAAAAGGFTTLATRPVTDPVNDNAFMTDFILRRARENSSVRILPVGALSGAKEGKKLAEIGSMAAAGVRAVGDGVPLMDSYLMRKGLEYARGFGLTVFSFPEDRFLAGQGVMNEGWNSNRLGLRGIPPAAEEIMVARDTVLAGHTGARLHFQPISTKGSLARIRAAKKEGILITAETHPVYFTLTSDVIATYDANYKCSPPLRSQEDVDAVVAALNDGTIDALASGHLPQSTHSKEQSFEQASFGMVSLETCLPLALELVRKKKLSFSRLIELLAAAPAQILGVLGEVGTLKPGAHADFVILDLEKKFTFEPEKSKSSAKNSPFFGIKLQGQVKFAYVGGTIVHSRKGEK